MIFSRQLANVIKSVRDTDVIDEAAYLHHTSNCYSCGQHCEVALHLVTMASLWIYSNLILQNTYSLHLAVLPSKLEYTAGTCPDVFKLAKVIPFHKSDNSSGYQRYCLKVKHVLCQCLKNTQTCHKHFLNYSKSPIYQRYIVRKVVNMYDDKISL